MRQVLSIILAIFACGTILAQPNWTKKASKSVFTIKTFTSDGTLLDSSYGFFVGVNGEAVSNFTPFVGAASAVAIDSEGNEMKIKSIIGANNTYDVIKIRVETKRSVPLQIAASTASEGSSSWLLQYSAKQKPICLQGTINRVEKFNDQYAYYTLGMKTQEMVTGCPLFNDAGQVIGLMHLPGAEGDTTSYAVSASFAESLKTNGLSINDATLNKTTIKKELPDDIDQAILTMYIGGSVLDSAGYATLVEDFISKFPTAADGYVYRAQLRTAANDFSGAESDMEQAIKLAANKDDAHFNYAKLIFQKQIYQDSISYEKWTLDKAAAEAQMAYNINPVGAYRQLEAQIRFAQTRYDDAFTIYESLFNTEKPTAELFFEAARCKEMLNDTAAVLALLDSAVNTFSRPYLKAAAPYILARAQALLNMKEYRKAVLDFNDYEKLMPNDVNANFYYIRGRAETEGRIYQAALNDYAKAIQMDSKNTLYLAEKASLEIRVGLYDEAAMTSQACISIAPELGEGYLFLGLAQCLNGNKEEGLENLLKAKELGDAQAQSLIDKYAQ